MNYPAKSSYDWLYIDKENSVLINQRFRNFAMFYSIKIIWEVFTDFHNWNILALNLQKLKNINKKAKNKE